MNCPVCKCANAGEQLCRLCGNPLAVQPVAFSDAKQSRRRISRATYEIYATEEEIDDEGVQRHEKRTLAEGDRPRKR